MAKITSTLIGIVFLLVGILGYVMPGFAGAHLNPVHNLIHLVSGVLALYFGTIGSLSSARLFCLIFGSVYLLLGIVGFLAGSPGIPTMPGMEMMGLDSRLLRVLPGNLELGTIDHSIHVGIGLVFLASGIATRRSMTSSVTQLNREEIRTKKSA